jgi:Secretion system C-terminal sorting domain
MMTSKQVSVTLVSSLIVVFSFSGTAKAQLDVELTPIRDNTLYENGTGAMSNGAGAHFIAGTNNQNSLRRAVLLFDIAAAIPSGSVIDSVQLTLHVSKSSSGNRVVSVHRILSDWGEGASVADGNPGQGAASTVGDATWIHTFFNTVGWSTVGGDFDDSPSAEQMVGGTTFYTWNSTAGLVDNVNDWLERPAENFGWLLRGDESTQKSTKRFDSRESTNAAFVPVLHVYYSTATHIEAPVFPSVVRDLGNYPNPFSATTTISYELDRQAFVTLEVFDTLGRSVQQLVHRRQPPGIHEVVFDGKHLPSGMYYYRLSTSGTPESAAHVTTGALLLMK